MGTGKTKIALDNACILYNRGKIDRLLVVAPKGTYMNWVEQEIPVHVPDYIEKKVLALVETLTTLKNQFTVIEQQNEYQDQKMKEYQEELEHEQKVREERYEHIKAQNNEETINYTNNKSCD